MGGIWLNKKDAKIHVVLIHNTVSLEIMPHYPTSLFYQLLQEGVQFSTLVGNEPGLFAHSLSSSLEKKRTLLMRQILRRSITLLLIITCIGVLGMPANSSAIFVQEKGDTATSQGYEGQQTRGPLIAQPGVHLLGE